MPAQTILILGGGVGGVVAANRLRKRLDGRHRIILVDREPSFTLASSFLWVMTGDRRPEQIARAEPRRVHFTDGETLDFDLLIHIPPIRPPKALVSSGLVDESGWVRVDRHTLETKFPGVYAVGDATPIPLAMGKPLPQAGVFAHGQAEAWPATSPRSWLDKHLRSVLTVTVCASSRRARAEPASARVTSTPNRVRQSACGILTGSGTRARCSSRGR